MKRIHLATLLVALAACHVPTATTCPTCPQAATTPPASPIGRALRTPVLRLTEHGAWGSPLQQAGIPEFTLYADGLVLFARGSGEDAKPMQVRLSADETNALVDAADAKVGEMDAQVLLVQSTDAPEAMIGVTNAQGRIYSVSVYGFGRAESGGPVLRPGFTALHDMLVAWDHADAEPWQPDQIEIAMARRDDLLDGALPWPASVPRPPADAREPRPRPMGRGGKTIQAPLRYLVDGALESDLDETLHPVTEGIAYAWNGSAWLVHYERVVPARTWFW